MTTSFENLFHSCEDLPLKLFNLRDINCGGHCNIALMLYYAN